MTWREWSPRLGVVLGYVLVAVAFTWPLPLHLGSHLTGEPGGDTGVYVWNQWLFQYEATSGANPLTTRQILSLSQRVDLSQHNYTAFLDLLALPLIPWLGVVAAFNAVMIVITILTALCGYALARLAFPTSRPEAFAAGLAFAWSPVLVARTTGHVSLVAAAPIAAFTWCLIHAERTRQTRFAVMAGIAMAWAAFCDAYFAVFCVMVAGLCVASQLLQVTRREARVPWAAWLLDFLCLSMAGLVLGLAFGGGGRIEWWGLQVSVRGLYTPVLVLTLLALARLALAFRARFVGLRQSTWFLRFTVIAGLACAGPLSPVLYGLGQGIADGRFVNPPILWRSSPRGVDLLAYLHPNPNHALSKWLLGDGQAAAPVVFVEYTAAFSLVALAVVAAAVAWARFRPAQGWWWLTAGFLALSLGPFVIVAGMSTHVPGPWALLRYVPIISAVRTPTRFAIVAALGLAILLAGALAAIGERWPRRRRAIGWGVLALLCLELMPAPRTLYSALYSPLSDIIAADPRPVRVLNLPFGVRDGTSSAGNFSARYQFEQTRHGKPLIGGYLSRVSSRRLAGMTRQYPILGLLIALSEGQVLSPVDAVAFTAAGRSFMAEAEVGYVIIDAAQVTPQLRTLAIDAFALDEVATDGTRTLYRPRP
jgi:hypothetical protein